MAQEAKKKQRIVVVGGGPTGAAVAKALADAKAGDVSLFEAYPHPESIEKNSPKAYVIALSERGQRGIEAATGIDPLSDIPNAVVSRHITRRPRISTVARDPPGLVVPRKFLASHLLNVAESAGVEVSYRHRLVDVDLAKRIATFEETPNGAAKAVTYDLLIGADGSNSQVRSLLNDKKREDPSSSASSSSSLADGGTFSVTRVEEDSMEYQVAVVPPSEAAFLREGIPDTSSHSWNDKKYNSICLAFPLARNEGMLFAMVFPEGKFAEFKEAHERDGTGYDDPLRSLMPDLPDAAKKCIVKQLLAGEPANGGNCVWCNSLGSPKDGVVLIGDAAHGMWPSLGQGANCALESAGIFAEVVRDVAAGRVAAEGATPWSELVVGEFQRRRHDDALAAVDLTYGGIGARESRGRLNMPLTYKLQVAGMLLLNKFTIGFVPKPVLIRVLTGDPVPYSIARKWNFFYEKWICSGLGALAVASTAAFILAK